MMYMANISKLYIAYWKFIKTTFVTIKKNLGNLIHLTKFQVNLSVLVCLFAMMSGVYVYIKNISYLKCLFQFQNSTSNLISIPLNGYSRIIFYF